MTTTKPQKPLTVADRINHLHPCEDAATWADGYTSPDEAWRECQRGDWMLWLLGKLSGTPESDDRKKLVLCAMECARLVLPIYEKRFTSDNRVRACIETAERWANGQATITELRSARSAAAAAAYAAAAADSAYATAAAYAAADAAAADAAYASAAAAAAAAAYAAADAAAAAAAYAVDDAAAAAAAYAVDDAAAAAAAYAVDAAAAAARSKARAECAGIVRKHYPRPPRIRAVVRLPGREEAK